MNNNEKSNGVTAKAKWLPHYHFFKLGHWINDPNGLFFKDNKYHLYFQLNPDATIWGNMHWGAAVSEDLIHWEHRPTALFAEPEGLGYIFSGGAIVDHENTSGFGKQNTAPIIATFTQQSKAEEQVQSIAYSTDGGTTYVMHDNNPVIKNPGIKDFRDPKVTRYVADDQAYWIKSVVAGQCVHFYKSDDLKSWTLLSIFGEGYGSHAGVWECPDLFPLRCAITDQDVWILFISINPGGPNGGSATQYFIGEFDGTTFTPQDNQTRWLDHGIDCYAGITWDNTPNILTERTYVAWMNNWNYANETPDDAWRGLMTLPRKVKLVKTDTGYDIATPVFADFSKGHSPVITQHQKQLHLNVDQAYKLEVGIAADAAVVSCEWRNGQNEFFSVVINKQCKEILVDRTHAGFSEKGFAALMTIPFECAADEDAALQVFADSCSFELFLNDGEQCITSLVFPSETFTNLTLENTSGSVIYTNLSDANRLA
jgi:fructan beta-fructosidase